MIWSTGKRSFSRTSCPKTDICCLDRVFIWNEGSEGLNLDMDWKYIENNGMKMNFK